MKPFVSAALSIIVWFGLIHCPCLAQQPPQNRLHLKDVFELEYASDPQISPDGSRIVYVRNFMDIRKDKRRSNLWIIDVNGDNHQPLTTGNFNDKSPRWSPDGKRLVYISNKDGAPQIYCRWMETCRVAQLTRLTSKPTDLSWSHDGKHIAFSMLVPEKVKPLIKLPPMPKGAQWAAPPKEIRRVMYRHDGKGYLPNGYFHLFIISAEGSTPQQITSGPYHDNGPLSWTLDDQSLIFSANRNKGWEYQPRESEIYEISIGDKKITQLTHRKGPDLNPITFAHQNHEVIAWTGFDDRIQGYQVTNLYGMSRKSRKLLVLTEKLNRSVRHLQRYGLGATNVAALYDDQGVTKVASITPNGKVKTLAANVGGTTIGRPYSSGDYSVSNNGIVAYTLTNPQHPADVAVYIPDDRKTRRLTNLNADLFAGKQLATVEEIWYKSSHDGRKIQGWIMKPPGFDPKKKYPLILEIHGGPFANYGPRFSIEMQLYAANGYVVFYANPRGSTSYGEEFGNLIHHAYPGHDYDDLMSGVDAVIKKGYIDEKNLFVTGGSGGGVLTEWIVGMTNRFTAAVVGKPVINWFSFVLTADLSAFFTQYWFPGPPWENTEHYMKRSPLSLVGNVTTPTMIITGEADHRTPMSESEQYYQALKLRKVKSMLVRIPGASHDISKRPSQLIAKVAYVLRWFEIHRNK